MDDLGVAPFVESPKSRPSPWVCHGLSSLSPLKHQKKDGLFGGVTFTKVRWWFGGNYTGIVSHFQDTFGFIIWKDGEKELLSLPRWLNAEELSVTQNPVIIIFPIRMAGYLGLNSIKPRVMDALATDALSKKDYTVPYCPKSPAQSWGISAF